MLLVLLLTMKCCTKMACPLPHNHYCCFAYFFHLYACLTCSSVHALSLHPLLAHHHLWYVDVYCVVFYFWYMQILHFFVTPFWIVCVHIFVVLVHLDDDVINWVIVLWHLFSRNKIWRKSNQKNRNLQKNKPKNKQPASLQKKPQLQKNKPKFTGKPQGWQHWRLVVQCPNCPCFHRPKT